MYDCTTFEVIAFSVFPWYWDRGALENDVDTDQTGKV